MMLEGIVENSNPLMIPMLPGMEDMDAPALVEEMAAILAGELAK